MSTIQHRLRIRTDHVDGTTTESAHGDRHVTATEAIRQRIARLKAAGFRYEVGVNLEAGKIIYTERDGSIITLTYEDAS